MKSFFKTFFAALLALIIFCVIGFFVLAGFLAGLTTPEKPAVGTNAVLVLDLSNNFRERKQENPIGSLLDDATYDVPALYDMVRMIQHAKGDSSVKGIYLLCAHNSNGYASSEELRKALIYFKTIKNFGIPYRDTVFNEC